MSESWSLPGYEVDCLIGFGATGEVWRARELATGDTVALKRLRDGLGPQAAPALRREARVLEEVDSPHVVRLRDVVDRGGELVLVLDHAAGGSLATLLTRRGALTPGEVVTIGAALAAALAALHSRGLVHGDVTPANVLFRADGMPMLSDLGLARLAGAPPAAVDGTAEYVDPAVVLGGEPDAAADVWALAAVCHHMLAGCAPHDGATVEQVLQAAATGARAPLGLLAGDAPRPLVEAVEAGLAVDPAGRPDAAGFARLLRRAHAAAPVRLSGGPDASGQVPPVRPTHAVRPAPGAHAAPSGPRRRRWRPPGRLVVGGAAVAVLLAAAAAGWASGRSAAPLPALAVVDAADTAEQGEATGTGDTGAVDLGDAEAPDAGGGTEAGVGVPPSTAGAPPTPASPAAAGSPAAGSPVAASPVGTPGPAPAPPDWPLVVRQLVAARVDALTTGDAARLLDAHTGAAPALAADRVALEQLSAAGHRPRGLRHVVHVVELLEADDTTARLRVVDELSSYALVDAAGQVVLEVPARPAAAQAVRLERTADGWRLASVEPYR